MVLFLVTPPQNNDTLIKYGKYVPVFVNLRTWKKSHK